MDDTSNSNTNNINSTIQQGNWRISLYNDSGDDHTSLFSGYSFSFSNGSITATKNGTTITGSYSSGTDDSQHKLFLNFGGTALFSELNDDWHILEENASIIRLEDVSGGNGGTDLLSFENN
ncbi:MAG: hypothetical protein RLZZ543_2193 [Bacteroidota bacterium]